MLYHVKKKELVQKIFLKAPPAGFLLQNMAFCLHLLGFLIRNRATIINLLLPKELITLKYKSKVYITVPCQWNLLH